MAWMQPGTAGNHKPHRSPRERYAEFPGCALTLLWESVAGSDEPCEVSR